MPSFDLAICGAGPAGTACALAAAKQGLRVVLFERSRFPRHKVCGDCLNPSLWPVLDALGVGGMIGQLDHAPLEQVRFVDSKKRRLEIPLPEGAERAVTRESFDHAMLQAALAAGVELLPEAPLTGVTRQNGVWHLEASGNSLTARALVAADGRNSTTCRLLGLSPAVRPGREGRIALQCHIPLHPDYRKTVALELMTHGYCGIAPVDATRMNVCLVSDARHLAEAREDLEKRFQIPPGQHWHSIAPLERADMPPAPFPGCYLAGDAARVVEPFTGEGIYYALRSGQFAAEAAARHLSGDSSAAAFYKRAHRLLYRRRLWVNRLSRLAVTQRMLGDMLLTLGRPFPSLLRLLTRKVVGAPPA